jgi:AbrB family looped-hinge helix DNA binding protein
MRNYITQLNAKGQVAIPKEFREALGINKDVALNMIVRGKSICIYPIADVLSTTQNESSYLKILEKTQGSWKNNNWDKLRSKRELSGSKKRKAS